MLYFPYGLRMVFVKDVSMTYVVNRIKEHTYEMLDENRDAFEIPYDSKKYKPVLYPIERIHSPVLVNRRKVVAADLICKVIYDQVPALISGTSEAWIVDTLLKYFDNSSACPFSCELMNLIYHILYALHFDLSGSLRKKEAKNIFRLGYHPYEFDNCPL